MKTGISHSARANRPIHKKETHILSIAVGILAFIIVYAFANEPKLYFGIAAAVLMAGAIYFANYLQFHRRNGNWFK